MKSRDTQYKPRNMEVPLIAVIISAILIIFALLSGLAFSFELPPNTTLIETQPLVCSNGDTLKSATYSFYDTDDHPENGAEIITLVVEGETNPRAVGEYAPGDDGTLKSITIMIPGKVPEVFLAVPDLLKRYPTACDIVTESEGQRR